MSDCIFCKIAQKEIQSFIIFESENFLVFLDIHPHSPGHCLLISKKHFETLEEMPTDYGKEFLEVTHKLILILKSALGTENFNFGVNNGPLAGQAIKHLHFHFMPRFANDGGGSMHSIVKNPPKENLEEIYNKIIKAKESLNLN